MPLAAIGQEDHGSGGGGGGGCGDVFGDLIHILRSDEGQPILAQRWVELPAEVPGYGWGYCPVAIDADGNELPFVPYSCDIDPAYVDDIQEVNYFGRLNGGRTKERNNRMHLDEVISNIKAAHMVKTDPAGRLMLGYDCTETEEGSGVYKAPCLEWSTIDSPMEHMGIYARVMKYGHLATDPYEIDTWAHGDPKAGTQFHVALGPEDWPKFHNSLRHLLPKDGEDPEACWDYTQFEEFVDSDQDGTWFAGEPFADLNDNCIRDEHEPFTDLDFDEEFDAAEEIIADNGNCVLDEFKFMCAIPEELSNRDFVSGATSLASAANKTGMITKDLIQYFNRILRVAKKTEHTVAPVNTLPALYRDCWDGADPDFGEEPPEADLDYMTGEDCAIVEADIPKKPKDDPAYCAEGTLNHCLYPDIEERFVDFGPLDDYEREADNMVLIINPSATTWEFPVASPVLALESDISSIWEVTPDEGIDLVTWMEAVNGDVYPTSGIDGFRAAASDILRTIEFIHNYAVPEILECTYNTSLCAVE